MNQAHVLVADNHAFTLATWRRIFTAIFPQNAFFKTQYDQT